MGDSGGLDSENLHYYHIKLLTKRLRDNNHPGTNKAA